MTNPDLTTAYLEEMEGLWKAATPGPWFSQKHVSDDRWFVQTGHSGTHDIGEMSNALRSDNAALIVAAVNALPALIHRARVAGEMEAFGQAYDQLRAAWSFRQASALHADDEKYRWACEKFDAAFDAADAARQALSRSGEA